jgi:hypothetical protein
MTDSCDNAARVALVNSPINMLRFNVVEYITEIMGAVWRILAVKTVMKCCSGGFILLLLLNVT